MSWRSQARPTVSNWSAAELGVAQLKLHSLSSHNAVADQWKLVSTEKLPFLLLDAVVTSWKQAGGSPAASHFSCLVKKSNLKKATQSRCPSGSRESDALSGKRHQLAALRHVSLLIRLPHHFRGCVPCGVGQKLRRNLRACLNNLGV